MYTGSRFFLLTLKLQRDQEQSIRQFIVAHGGLIVEIYTEASFIMTCLKSACRIARHVPKV